MISYMRAAALLAWERARERTGDLITVVIVGGIGALTMIGFLEATDVELRPYSVLGGALTAEMGDSGLPYIAIDLDALGQNENEPTTASGERESGGESGRDRKSGSSPILLVPVVSDLFTFGGDDSPTGTDPQPPPDPRPAPGHSPSPSPSPSPTPSRSQPPEPPPEPSPSSEPPPEPSPTDPSPEPSPTDPSPEPSPTDPSPEPSPTDPSPEPSP